jgi:hypothetical protein
VISKHFGPETSVGLRLYALALLSPAAFAAPDPFGFLLLCVIGYLCVSLATRIANPETCFRCRSECRHEPPFGEEKVGDG